MDKYRQEEILVGILLLLFAVAAVIATLVTGIQVWRKKRKEKAETRRKEDAEAREKRLECMRNKLVRRNFAVVIRTRNGGKTGFETELIGALRDLDANVYNVPPPDGDALSKTGTFAKWLMDVNAVVVLGVLHEDPQSTLDSGINHLDIRMINPADMTILGAKSMRTFEKGFRGLTSKTLATIASAKLPTEPKPPSLAPVAA